MLAKYISARFNNDDDDDNNNNNNNKSIEKTFHARQKSFL